MQDYIERISKNREWGGNLVLKALSDVLGVSFIIHQLDAPRFVMRCTRDPTGRGSRSVHLAYSGMMHYDAVRHASGASVYPYAVALRVRALALASLPLTKLKASWVMRIGCWW